MHHLDEMARAGRTAIEVALFDARIAPRSARSRRNRAAARRQRGEDRVEMIGRFAVSADHHAIAALEAPNAAARSDIEIADALGIEQLGMGHVLLDTGIAAIDQGVAGLEKSGELALRAVPGRAGRQHDPDRARLVD